MIACEQHNSEYEYKHTAFDKNCKCYLKQITIIQSKTKTECCNKEQQLQDLSKEFPVENRNRSNCRLDNLNNIKDNVSQIDLIFVNVQSITNKINEIESLLTDEQSDFHNVSVLCISEHWLHSSEASSLWLTGYNICSFLCRSIFKNGGVLQLIKNNINTDLLLTELNSLSVEKDCEISISCRRGFNMVIITLFRAPSGDMENFYNVLHQLLSSLDIGKAHIILGGDFNVNFANESSTSSRLCIFLTSFGFHRTCTFPTRGNNCLDTIFTNFHCTL